MQQDSTQAHFSNHQIPLESVDQLSQISFSPLLPRYIQVIRINFVLLWFLGAVVFAVVLAIVELELSALLWLLLALGALWCLSLGISLWAISLSFSRRGYAVREHDISHRSGVFFVKTETIPLDRVQQVSLSQSPIARLLDFYTVEVDAAGGASCRIRGLEASEAEALRDHILSQIRHDY